MISTCVAGTVVLDVEELTDPPRTHIAITRSARFTAESVRLLNAKLALYAPKFRVGPSPVSGGWALWVGSASSKRAVDYDPNHAERSTLDGTVRRWSGTPKM